MAASQGMNTQSGRQVAISGRQSGRVTTAGKIKVGTDKGWLRLRWTHEGKRYALTLGLPDTEANRTHAEKKAYDIWLDIFSNNFDPTLKKYKSQAALKRSQISAVNLFRQFTEEKTKEVYHRTLEKYQATIKYLSEYFKDKPAESIDVLVAERFITWLGEYNGGRVLKERIGLLKACWHWGQKKSLVELNPWEELVSRVKVSPKQPLKPFSREEIGAIIVAFRGDRCYSYYADYVEFLFGTGCRIGEAIGLRWRHVSDDCSMVWIGESLSRGVRKSTKTNKARTNDLTPELQAMLLARRPAKPDPDGLVFTSPTGKPIDDHNFRNRAWKTVLIRLEIDYRKPYTTRSTMVSHALALDENPMLVAQLTGHDPRVMFDRYAGYINSRPRLPKLWEVRAYDR